jgi:hypothetical protein
VTLKIVYLDQNHWIELSKAVHGKDTPPQTHDVLNCIRQAKASGGAVFPLSLAHYYETLKKSAPDRRQRLTAVMRELSGGQTISDIRNVVRHEIEVSLGQYFKERAQPREFTFLGSGLEYTFGRKLGLKVEWPASAKTIPEGKRNDVEQSILELVEVSVLSGAIASDVGGHVFPKLDLTPDDKFREALYQWCGVVANYSPEELERRIFATTLADIQPMLEEVLVYFNIGLFEFAMLGERIWREFLNSMPSRKADMHLRRQWAKNADLIPRQSDLNDWAYLGIAVSYCDVVVTENQMSDLFSRGLNPKAKVLSKFKDLPALL